MSINDVTAENLSSTNTTVVRALGTRETIDGPTIRSVTHVEKGVLLLETEPRLMGLVGFHELSTLVTVVVLVWCSIRIPALAHKQDVWGATNRVGEDGTGAKVDVGVITRSLTSRASIEVPLGEILKLEITILGNLCNGLSGQLA